MTETTWFWIGTVGMSLGAVAVFAVSKMCTPDEEGHTVVHTVVPLVAACSYFATARTAAPAWSPRYWAPTSAMIAAGLFSGLSEDPDHRWTWFLVSSGAFLAVYAALFGPLWREATRRDAERRRAFGRNIVILAALWLVYPIVVALGPDGAGVTTALTTAAFITVLDLAAKVGYGLVAALGSGPIAEADLARDEVTPAALARTGAVEV